ncbi:hypothetical protein [Desulfosporosinus sp.]|uniref:hypothetical protein n=1 Tax=Desulfosporosinus sp. TaxID=157907 RepID=UPI0025C58561|nr:hypothetical protein [Desulfosporosinus sp.]MBC2724166.1 hypothetical protein [Desulfosporosinus sp.]MBC2726074.1 hypothetical protein [Desulfosporosinus sp.]
MPKYLIYPLYVAVFAVILAVAVPRKDIYRLSIHGIIFGGAAEFILHMFGKFTGLYVWYDHGPLGYKGIQIFSPVSWGIFFILYYYFLPKHKPLNYIYMVVAIFFSILYTNLVISLGVFYCYDRFFVPLIAFIVWFSVATWGYYKLNNFIEKKEAIAKARE